MNKALLCVVSCGLTQRHAAPAGADVEEWTLLEVEGSREARFLPAVAFAGGIAYMFGGVLFEEGQQLCVPRGEYEHNRCVHVLC